MFGHGTNINTDLSSIIVDVVDVLTVSEQQQLGQVIEDHSNTVIIQTVAKPCQE